MTRGTVTWVLLAAWAVAFAASFHGFLFAEPTGDGFTRGMNRVMTFLAWQIGAGLLAIVLWQVGKGDMRLRWLVRLPALVAALLMVAVVALILWARLSKPAPMPEPPTRVTLPPVNG
ncbi:MAG: hypothetical protein KDK24_15565 [Pseudooceanicola sp.]|nr:hypothetical protein [Pseudooceanicola sp.]